MMLSPTRHLAGMPRMLKTVAASLLAAGLALAPVASQAKPTVIIGKDGWLFPGWESYTTLDRHGVDDVVDIIAQTKAALAARNVALMVMVVPFKATYYMDKLPQGTVISPEAAGRYDYILGRLRQTGVDTLDIRAALQSVQKGKQTAFFRADYHWTAWAAEAAADAMAQAIKAKFPRLAGSPGSGDKLGPWVTQRVYGDLATGFLTPEQQRQVGPDLYTVRQGTTSSGGLLGPGGTPVHIVGNSFVQPYLGFPQKLSADLDRPVSLTWKEGNNGPYGIMLDFLSSPDFQRSPPQVLIWQFNEGAFHSVPDSADQWLPEARMTTQTFLSRMHAALGR